MIKRVGPAVLVAILMICCAAVCWGAESSASNEKAVYVDGEELKPQEIDETRFITVKCYNVGCFQHYNIMVDKETGVMYVYAIDGLYGRAMSPLLNPDGTPQIYDSPN